MKSKFNISKIKAEKIVLREKKTIDTFIKKHLFNSRDPLTLILKVHLYIEICLDQIITSVLPKPNKIIRKRFADKVDFFEALGLPPDDGILIEKIRTINNMRNAFAHNLNKKLNLKDIQPLLKNIKVKSNKTIRAKLKDGLVEVVGYLHCLKVMNRLFPFLMSWLRNKEIYKKDKGYHQRKIIDTYPFEELKEILENLKME